MIRPPRFPDCVRSVSKVLVKYLVKYLLVRPGTACRIDNKEALARLSVFFTLPMRIRTSISLGSMKVIDC